MLRCGQIDQGSAFGDTNGAQRQTALKRTMVHGAYGEPMNEELARKLWQVLSMLRGVGEPGWQIEQAACLLYLKLLGEEDAAHEAAAVVSSEQAVVSVLFRGQARRYRWSEWSVLEPTTLRDFVLGEVLPYMASVEREDPATAYFFRDLDVDGTLNIKNPQLLADVVREIDSIELLGLDPATRGDLLEGLLDRFSTNTREGSMRTPPQLRNFLVQLVDPRVEDTVYDPFCGTGGFLVGALRHVAHRPGIGDALVLPPAQLGDRIIGCDINRRMVRIATLNLMLNGVRHPRIVRTNSFLGPIHPAEEQGALRYSAILSSPPMGIRLGEEAAGLKTGTSDGDLAVLRLLMDSLAPGGRCAVVVPYGVLRRSSRDYREARRRLCEVYNLHAVVALPGEVWAPGASISTAALVFSRPQDPDRSDRARFPTWFVDMTPPAWEQQRPVHGDSTSTVAAAAFPEVLREWYAFEATGFTRAPGYEAGSALPAEVAEPLTWWAAWATLKDNEWSLDPSLYRPRRVPSHVVLDPADLVREILATEREIHNELEVLLRDLEAS